MLNPPGLPMSPDSAYVSLDIWAHFPSMRAIGTMHECRHCAWDRIHPSSSHVHTVIGAFYSQHTCVLGWYFPVSSPSNSPSNFISGLNNWSAGLEFGPTIAFPRETCFIMSFHEATWLPFPRCRIFLGWLRFDSLGEVRLGSLKQHSIDHQLSEPSHRQVGTMHA